MLQKGVQANVNSIKDPGMDLMIIIFFLFFLGGGPLNRFFRPEILTELSQNFDVILFRCRIQTVIKYERWENVLLQH